MNSNDIRYYDVQRHWTKKLVPHLANPELNRILVEDFNKYTFGRWNQPFTLGKFPDEFETCDWRFDHRGPTPRFWRYVKHAACHWLVNFNLKLAELAEPKRPWRIITSVKHSSVWDGKNTLFDMNFLALGVPAQKAFSLAFDEMLQVGEPLDIDFASHFSDNS